MSAALLRNVNSRCCKRAYSVLANVRAVNQGRAILNENKRKSIGINSNICRSQLNSSVSSIFINERSFSAEVEAEAEVATEKECSEKVQKIVNEITLLNLVEVSELVETLKKELNLPATPMGGMGMMPMMGGAPAAGAGAAPVVEEEKAEKPIVDIQLESYDAKNKIKIIKEVKTITGLGLKEAKALVDGAPGIVKKEIKREDAKDFVDKLEAVGAKIALV